MPDASPAARAAARAYTNGALDLNLNDLTTALNEVYGDSYVTGLLTAAQQTGATMVAGLGQTLPVGPAEWATFWDKWTPGNQPAADLLSNGGLADLLAQTDVTIKGIEGTTLDRLGNLLADGVANGESVDTIARSMGEFIDDPDRAYQIANTECARSVSNASMDGYTAADIQEVDWLISPDACPECEDYADNGPYALDDAPGQPAHPSCFPAGTITTGPQIVGSIERWYDGELIEIVTAAGRLLAVTPNHPILTPDGFVLAGKLDVGGDVIGCRDAQRVASLVDPDHYHGPSLIEDVAETLGRTSLVTAVTMPTTAVDFHGDGVGSDVHIVRTDGLLRDDLADSTLSQPFTDEQFSRRNTEATFLPGASTHDLLSEGLSSNTRGLMSSGAESLSLVGVGLGHASEHSSAFVAEFDSGLGDHSSKGRSRDAVTIGKSLQRNSSQVVSDQSVWSGQESPVAAEPTSSEGSTEYGASDASLFNDLFHRCPRNIQSDRIIELSRRHFAGHVYNLQTVAGWYTANGIIVHNCRCSYSPRDTGPAAADSVPDDSGE